MPHSTAASTRHDDALDDDDDEVTVRIGAAEKQRLVASAFASNAEPASFGHTSGAFPAIGQPRWLEIAAPPLPPLSRPPPPRSGRRPAVAPYAIIRHAGRAAVPELVPESFPRRTASLVMPSAVVSTASLSPAFLPVQSSVARRYLSEQLTRAARALRDLRLAVRACLLVCVRRVRRGVSARPRPGSL